MTPAVWLFEHETVEVDLPAEVARALASTAPTALTVSPAPAAGRYRLTAGSHVGTIRTGETLVRIRPKIPLENVFALLDVDRAGEAWRDSDVDYAVSPDLLAAMAAVYGRQVERLLASGLHHFYRETRERLVALRGRVDLRVQMARPGIEAPIACVHDDYTADVAENRYLKAALRRIVPVPGVPPRERALLRRCLDRFGDVADVHVEAADRNRIHLSRLNERYWPALGLARLILASLTLADRSGEAIGSAFLVDMNRLFQDWVADRLRRALRGRLVVAEEPTWHLDTRRGTPMSPDLVFERAGRLAYVADTKYKLTATGHARNADLYQLLAYCTASRLPEGALIYCMAEGGQPASEIVVRHAGTRIHTKAIDLSGPPARAEAAIAELGDWILGRVEWVTSASNDGDRAIAAVGRR